MAVLLEDKTGNVFGETEFPDSNEPTVILLGPRVFIRRIVLDGDARYRETEPYHFADWELTQQAVEKRREERGIPPREPRVR